MSQPFPNYFPTISVGSQDQCAAFAACECYDPVTGDWTRLPPMPTARAGAACAVAEKTPGAGNVGIRR